MTSAAKISRSARIAEIQAVLAELGVKKAMKPVMSRLSDSPDALVALAEMELSNTKLIRLLRSFVTATQLKKKFRAILEEQRQALARCERLRDELSDLRAFVKQTTKPRKDGIRATIRIGDEDRSQCLQGLYVAEQLIDMRERVARETPTRIGATRKTLGKKADENAAIGWLAASIDRIVGRPFIRQSGLLAGIIFDIDEVSEDRLRRALRNFTDRDWRQR